MAATTVTNADPLNLKKRSRWLGVYTLQRMLWTKLMGLEDGFPIRLDNTLRNQAGDTVTISGRFPLQGAGVGNDGLATGALQGMRRRNMTITVNENSMATAANGAMSLQRIEDFYGERAFIQEADVELADWQVDRLETDIITGLSGGYNENASSGDIETINEVEPSSARCYFGGQTIGSSAVLSTTYATVAALTAAGAKTDHYFGRLVWEQVMMQARTATPRFRPIRVAADPTPVGDNGKSGLPVTADRGTEYLLWVIAPQSWKTLKNDSQFSDMLANAEVRGLKNPLLGGQNIWWDGAIGTMYERCLTRTGAGGTTLAEGFTLNAGRTATTDPCATSRSVACNLLLGADAGCLAWAKPPELSQDTVDINKPAVKLTTIYGFKTVQFNTAGTSTPESENGRFCVYSEY